MSNEIMNLIETLVVAPLAIAISAFLIALIRQQTAKIESSVKDNKVKRLIQIAESAVDQAVTSVTQTYVDGLKKEGAFDSNAQKDAFEKSKQNVRKLLTADAISAVKDAFGDFDEWLETKIEEAVYNNKVS